MDRRPKKYVVFGVVLKHGSHGLIYDILRIMLLPIGIPGALKWLAADAIDWLGCKIGYHDWEPRAVDKTLHGTAIAKRACRRCPRVEIKFHAAQNNIRWIQLCTPSTKPKS